MGEIKLFGNKSNNKMVIKELFEWDDNIKVFIQEVDEEHKQLVDIINSIHTYTLFMEEKQLEVKKEEEKQLKNRGYSDNISSQMPLELAELYNLIEQLKNYTIYHFRNEEEYMQKQGLDRMYIHKHHNQHLNFRQQVEIMINGMFSSDINVKTIQKLLNFLINWLVLHIVGEDKDMVKQIRYIKDEGLSPKEAYNRVESERDSQATVMVKALQELLVIFQERSAELAKIQEETQKQVDAKTNEYLKMYREYESLAQTDQLTGIYNRKKAMDILDNNWKKYDIDGNNFSILHINLDGFKSINDNFGHDKGDLVLKVFADKVVNLNIFNSLFCRLSGDEFLMILENTNNDEAVNIANDILSVIRQVVITSDDNKEIWKGSASIGVASTTNLKSKNYNELLKEADNYLQEAKYSGKNCIVNLNNSIGDYR